MCIVFCSYIGLDIGTLHHTLPSSLWGRHERRPPPLMYQPSDTFDRYKPSLKHFIPIRKSNRLYFSLNFCLFYTDVFLPLSTSTKEMMPLDNAGLFSFLTFSWVTPYMKMAYHYGLKAEDVPLISSSDSCEYTAQRYLNNLNVSIFTYSNGEYKICSESTELNICGMKKSNWKEWKMHLYLQLFGSSPRLESCCICYSTPLRSPVDLLDL